MDGDDGDQSRGEGNVSVTTTQLLAVSALLSHSETIAESGVLDERAELRLREAIALTLSAFKMPTRHERIAGPEVLRAIPGGIR